MLSTPNLTAPPGPVAGKLGAGGVRKQATQAGARTAGNVLWIISLAGQAPEHAEPRFLLRAAFGFLCGTRVERCASSRDTCSRATETSLLLMQRSRRPPWQRWRDPRRSQGCKSRRKPVASKGPFFLFSEPSVDSEDLLLSEGSRPGRLSTGGFREVPRAEAPLPKHRQSADRKRGPCL